MISSFRDENDFLSNFYEKPVSFGGCLFRNRESAYQWAKFIGVDALDREVKSRFTRTTGSEAKALAKELKPYVRPDWLQVNLGIMTEIIHAYFVQNKDERFRLVLTYPQELIEGNWWHDNFWGICMNHSCRCEDGRNWLGRILMAERAFWLDLMAKDHYKDDRLVEKFNAQQKVA